MRVYHFVGEKHGIQNLMLRRLKIATLDQLNDPFELYGFDLGDKDLRRALYAVKRELTPSRGLLCFSKSCLNPVQWSHYADRHKGICLAFDVPRSLADDVGYTHKRVSVLKRDGKYLIDESVLRKALLTKYAHWRYESEVRIYCELNDRDVETGLYFADFSNQLVLKQVIVGSCCTLSKADVVLALGDLAENVSITKARLAFRTFQVVTQHDQSLW